MNLFPPDDSVHYFPHRPGYTVRINKLPGGDWYWHLFWRTERVNGGMDTAHFTALHSAEVAAYRDSYERGLPAFRLDRFTDYYD